MGGMATIERARQLRRSMTQGEKRLWQKLRGLRHSHGLHVRRQVPIGPYIADFAIHAVKLIIEVDGEHHQAPDQQALDQQRDAWFASQGYRTLRFSTGDVVSNIEGCVQAVLDASKPPPLTPPHKGEGNFSVPGQTSSAKAGDRVSLNAQMSPLSPLWGGKKGGGQLGSAASDQFEGDQP